MIPVNSILEVNETSGSFGFSYLSYSFGNGKKPERMTYVPIRDSRGVLMGNLIVAAETISGAIL
jgi:hypothetical protein